MRCWVRQRYRGNLVEGVYDYSSGVCWIHGVVAHEIRWEVGRRKVRLRIMFGHLGYLSAPSILAPCDRWSLKGLFIIAPPAYALYALFYKRIFGYVKP